MEFAPCVHTAYNKALSQIKGRLDGHYQHEGVKWMLSKELQNDEPKGGILADEMGLGKTMQSITVMRGNPQPTLIITMVGLVGQWRDALFTFGGIKPIIVNCSYQGILPQDVGDSEHMVVLATYSCFQKARGQTPPCLHSQSWGRIVMDEGHIMRNKNTKLYQEVSRLSSLIKWILTGTPVQNGTKDLISLLKLIGIDTNHDIDTLRQAFILRRTQRDEGQKNTRLQLPPLETQVLYIDFATDEERRIYAEVEDYFRNCVEARHTSTDASSAMMEGIIRCRQICSHPKIYFEGCLKNSKNPQVTKKSKTDIPAMSFYNEGLINNDFQSSKIGFLCKDIEESVIAKKTKCLVFCTWTLELRLVQNALKNKSIPSLIYDGGLSRDNKETVLHNFTTSSIPVLILQITCGSTGLNLQCASKVYVMSPHWNPCLELQAIGRAYRKGQTNVVSCVRMVVKNTIEERCIDVQNEKASVIMETMMDNSIEDMLGSYKECDVRKLFAVEPVVPKVIQNDSALADALDELLFHTHAK